MRQPPHNQLVRVDEGGVASNTAKDAAMEKLGGEKGGLFRGSGLSRKGRLERSSYNQMEARFGEIGVHRTNGQRLK